MAAHRRLSSLGQRYTMAAFQNVPSFYNVGAIEYAQPPAIFQIKETVV